MDYKSQPGSDELPEYNEMTSPRQHLYRNSDHVTIVNIPSIPCETMNTSQDNMSISTTGDIDSSALNYSEIGLPDSTIQANTLERFNHNGSILQTSSASLGYSEIEMINSNIEANYPEQITTSGSTPSEEMGYSEIGMPQSNIQTGTFEHGVTPLIGSSGKHYDSMRKSEIENPPSIKPLENIDDDSLNEGNAHGKQIFSLDDKISKTDNQFPQKARYEINTRKDILPSHQRYLNTRATTPRGPSRDILTIPLRSSVDSNLVNFNSPEIDKEPQSLKEMEKLFSQELSNDTHSNSDQSKSKKDLEERQPFSNLLELGNRNNVKVDRDGTREVSCITVYNKKTFDAASNVGPLHSSDSTKRKVLGRSFEDLPGTGKHIRNIYIKGFRRYTGDSGEDQTGSRRRSRSTESDASTDLGLEDGNQGRVSLAKSYFENKKYIKHDCVDNTLQPIATMPTKNGRQIPRGSNFGPSAPSKDSKDYDDIYGLTKFKEEGKSTASKRTSTIDDSRKNLNITTGSDSPETKKKTIHDYRDREKILTSKQSSVSAAAASQDIKVSVTSMDEGSDSKSLVPHSESKKTRRRAKNSSYDQSPYNTQRVELPKRSRDDNINVYVNVNVNMIQPDSMDQRIRDGNQNTLATDDYKESKSDSSQGSDKTSRSDHDYEFSSSDCDSFNQELMMFKSSGSRPEGLVTDNLSVNYYADQFRIMNNLGMRGLSPIPSVSYESDSTNRQLDSSSADGGKVTPTRGECPSVSSNSTLKDNHSDDDSVDLKKLTERHYFKSQSKAAFSATDEVKQPRKLSFNDEVISIPDFSSQTTGDDKRKRSISKSKRERDQPRRTVVSRSHSQPEQYLMQKRQSAISQMSAQQSLVHGEYMDGACQRPRLHSWHKPVCKQGSEGATGARYKGFTGNYEDDNRLPLNVRAPTSPISNDDNDQIFPKGEGFSGWTRFDFSRSSWHMRSPYSSRVRRTSSLISDGSRSGKRSRQLSVDIGEEWESVHKSTRPRTVSDASSLFSYRSLRQIRNKDRITVEDHLAGERSLFTPIKQPDEPSREKDTEDGLLHADVPVVDEIETPFSAVEESDTQPKEAQPQAVVVAVEAEREDDFFTLPPEKRILLNNPYNDINQRFHSTLHCPCFIFFCFLCCAPAVYWMQRSDYEFDYASEKLAKKYGRRATILYVTGAILSILLLTGAIVATVILLEDHLTADTTL